MRTTRRKPRTSSSMKYIMMLNAMTQNAAVASSIAGAAHASGTMARSSRDCEFVRLASVHDDHRYMQSLVSSLLSSFATPFSTLSHAGIASHNPLSPIPTFPAVLFTGLALSLHRSLGTFRRRRHRHKRRRSLRTVTSSLA